MQPLFDSYNAELALTFRDYIRKTYGVELQVEPLQNQDGSQGASLLVDPNLPQLTQILQATEDFLRNPLDQKYRASSWQTGDLQNNDNLRAMFNPQRASFWLHAEKITALITLVCVLVYGAMYLGAAEWIGEWFHFPAEEVERNELWRYLSHTLVHLSPLHILFNLSWWWIFGGAIERECGSKKLFQIYLLSGLISGVAQYLVAGPWFFGLSGVVYAVLGYVFVADKFAAQPRFDLPSGFLSMLLVGIALGFAGPLVDVNIGNSAHIAGLLTGCAIAWLDSKGATHRRANSVK